MANKKDKGAIAIIISMMGKPKSKKGKKKEMMYGGMANKKMK